jgi:CHAT domain-containing protein
VKERRLAQFLLITLGFGCDIARSAEDDAGSTAVKQVTALDSVASAADSLYKAGSYADAKQAWSAALAVATGTHDVPAEARALTSLGLTEWRLGNYGDAWKRVDDARRLLETNRLESRLPRTLNALGLIAWDQGRLSDAAALWRQTMQIAQKVGDQEYIDKPSMNLGLWYAGIGDLEHARQAFIRSLAAGRKLGVHTIEVRSLVNLAMVANESGDPRQALAWLDSASRAGVSDDFLAEDNYRSQLAMASWGLGDPGLALAALDSAVRIARTSKLPQSEAANLALMAEIYWEAGDLTRALGLHARAEAINAELDLPTEQGQNLHSAARIYMAMGHADRARAMAVRALKLHQRAEDVPHEFDDRLLLAELGDARQLPTVRSIAAKLATRAARTKLGLAEARIAANARRPREVLRALAAIQRDLDSGLSAEVAEGEELRAQAYASLEQWDSAAAAGRRGISAIDRIQSRHSSDLLRASFASVHAALYGHVVGALIALGHTDEAFDLADDARGGSARTADSRAGSIKRMHDEELLRRIGALEDGIRLREEDGLDAQELRARLRKAEREYELAVLNAGNHRGVGTQRDASLQRVRQHLAPEEAMLAYLVTPERLFVFTVSRQRTRVRAVTIRASEVEARVRLARQMVANPNDGRDELRPMLASLSALLLSDLESSVRRLIIVPHGALTYVPFAALQLPDKRYLIERYSLVHLPSASFIGRASSSVAFSETPVAAFAPLSRELPASAQEVAAIGRVHRRTRVLVGPRADEPMLREALTSGAVTHVASHGVLNPMNPLFSRIELASQRKRHPADDGRLEVHEVLDLQIRSPLVFLSGCETGLGPGGSRRYTPGEDYATLAAAFLGAGARQVVATLWSIPDNGAAVFAGRFYEELARRPAADALATSQRAMLTSVRFAHPYYWAGYRLAGWESIRRPSDVS